MQGRAGLRFNGHDFRPITIPGSNAADQSATAHCDQHRVEAGALILQFQAECALTGKGRLCVVRMHRYRAGFRNMRIAQGECFRVVCAVLYDFGTI